MSHTLESKIYHALKEQFPGDFAWAAGAQTATKIAEAHYAKSEPDHGNFRLDEHIDPALLDPLVESYMLDRDERGAQMANLPSFSEWYAMASDPNAHQKIAEPDWFKAAVRTDGCDWECIHCGAGYHMQPVTETCSVIDCPMNLLRPTASMAQPVEGEVAKPSATDGERWYPDTGDLAAFARPYSRHPDGWELAAQEGLTKREAFAKAAMQGIIAAQSGFMIDGIPVLQYHACARESVKYADALLEVLSK